MNLYSVLFYSLVIAIIVLLIQHSSWFPKLHPIGTRWMTKGFIWLGGIFLADDAKRMIVASSLCSHITEPKLARLDNTIIARLNEISQSLHLTNHMQHAVRFPAAYHDVIWGNTLNIELLRQHKLSPDDIVAMIPKPLCYDTPDKMRADIFEVMRVSQCELALA